MWLLYTLAGHALGFTGGHGSLFSILWTLAAISALSIDVYITWWRRTALSITLLSIVLVTTSPWNSCSCIDGSLDPFSVLLKITLFHIVWHSNRLLRTTESVLYDLYARRVTQVLGMAPKSFLQFCAHQAQFDQHWQLQYPTDLVTSWRQIVINTNIANRSHTYSSLIEFHAVVKEAGSGLSHLTSFCMTQVSHCYTDWKYRDYSHNLMTVIDLIRAVWILGACFPYTLLAFIEIGWIWRVIHCMSEELVSASSPCVCNEEAVPY